MRSGRFVILLVLLPVAILLGCLSGFAQECAVNTPITGMTIGPLSFLSVSSPSYTVSGEQQIGGQILCNFTWTGQTSTFSLKRNLVGTVRNLTVNGVKNRVAGGGVATFSIPMGGLQFDLHITRPVIIPLFGSRITIPVAPDLGIASYSDLHVTNIAPIDTRGLSGKGTLAFTVDSLPLANAHITLPYGLPEIVASFQSSDTLTFYTDVASAITRLQQGRFIAGVKAGYSGRTFSLAQPTYNGVIRKIIADSIDISVLGSSATVTASGISLDTSVVVKKSAALSFPLYITGNVTAQRATGHASYSGGPAILPQIELSHFRFRSANLPAGSYYQSDEVPASHVLQIDTLSDYQNEAITNGMNELSTHPSFNFFASVPSADVKTAITPFFTKYGFPAPQQVSLEQQQITATAALPSVGDLSTSQVGIFHIAPSVKDQNLTLGIDLTYVRLDDVGPVTNISSDALMSGVAGPNNGSGTVLFSAQREVSIPIDAQIIKGINLTTSSTFGSTGSLAVHGTPVNLTMQFLNGVILVDADGVHILSTLGDK